MVQNYFPSWAALKMDFWDRDRLAVFASPIGLQVLVPKEGTGSSVSSSG